MITPEEISSRQFLVSLRGYDREEVSEFLSAVADHVRHVEARVAELEAAAAQPAEPSPTPPPPSAFADVGAQTQRVLEAAEEAGAELRRQAEEAARAARAEAAEDAERIRAEAQQAADRQRKEVRAESVRLIATAERQVETLDARLAGMDGMRDELAAQLRDVGRTVERVLRDLLPPDEAETVSVRAALAAAVATDEHAPEPEPADEAAAARWNGALIGENLAGEDLVGQEMAAAPAEATEDTEDTDHAESRQPLVSEAAGSQPAAEPELATPVAPPGAGNGERPARTPEPASPGEALGLRSAALGPLHPKLTRRLTRQLREIHGDLLHRLRAREDAALEPRPRLVEQLAGSVAGYLNEAFAAGCEAGMRLSGLPVSAHLADPGMGDDLANAVREQLTRALADVRVRADGASRQETVAQLDAAVASLIEGTVEELSALALLRCYERGLARVWTSAGITHRRWLLATEPECPDPRCADNVRRGAVPFGEAFPSGHDAPPVRVGCACSTVPQVTEATESARA